MNKIYIHLLSMYSIVVLGARCTGKTTLASHCLDSSLSNRAPQNSPYAFRFHTVAFEELTPSTVNNAVVLDPKPTNTSKLVLAQDLARRSVPACLITIPRDVPAELADKTADRTVEWISFAREYCPFARVALVVTKTDCPATVPDHTFDSLTLDVMRRTNADRLFFVGKAPPEGVKAWLLDVLANNNPAHRGIDLSQFGTLSTTTRRKSSAKENRKNRDGCGTDQRTCDSCAVS